MRRSLVIFGFAIWCAQQGTTAAEPNVDDLYKRGTDIGAAFLAEHAPRLSLMITLEECGERDMAARVFKSLPKSQQYALAKQDLAAPNAEVVAQIARAYVVGYETGVRTEYRRQDDLTKGKICVGAKSGTP